MFFLFSLILAKTDVRFLALEKSKQPFKTTHQLIDYKNEVKPTFRMYNKTSSYVFNQINGYDVFQFRNETDLIASLFIEKKKYFGKNKTQKDVLHIYTVYTNKKYRGMNYATELIKRSLEYAVNSYKLKNPMIALHLNPFDEMMNFNYAFYCNMGFERASVVEYGPSDFKMLLHEIPKLDNVREAMRKVENSDRKGYCFALFCPYENLMKKEKIDYELLKKEGEDLRKKLLDKKERETGTREEL